VSPPLQSSGRPICGYHNASLVKADGALLDVFIACSSVFWKRSITPN